MSETNWYKIKNPEELISPSLLVYPERIEANIKKMIEMVGEVSRLRPHVKTHKMAEVIKMQMDHGIAKFKCATIAEAELLGKCKAPDVLLAMQAVGANVGRFLQLIKAFPETSFSTLVDNELSIEHLAEAASKEAMQIQVFLDLNTGMDRTGIAPGERAKNLFQLIAINSNLLAQGLHAYDGHIRSENFDERKRLCDLAFQKVLDLKKSLEAVNVEVKTIVAGGSPSFPIHATRKGVEVSPGTTLLWDERYGNSFKEMTFLPAAVLFTRVISKPRKGIVCLDLGHKSVAPEMNLPRVKILEMEDSEQLGQSEEHLVLKYSKDDDCKIGDDHYAIPMHICPTVAKYPRVFTVSEGEISGSWKVAARDHQLEI